MVTLTTCTYTPVSYTHLTTGTITDFDGNFTLNVPQNSILSITFVGYKAAEIKAAPSVMVTLEDDSQVLDAVVVVGYGTVTVSYTHLDVYKRQTYKNSRDSKDFRLFLYSYSSIIYILQLSQFF